MKNILKITVLFVALLACTASLQAQKFGYVNSNLILSEHPEVKQANANIESFRKQIKQKYEKDLAALQEEYAAAQAKAGQGLMTPKEQEEVAAQLQAKQNELLKFEQDSQQNLMKKQEDLLQPIIDKINQAIQDVGKEQGYQFIFDAQVLLYADETVDVTEMVKAKLN